VGQECERISRKGAEVSGDKQEVRQECEGVSRKWGKSVNGSAGNGAEV